MKEEKNTAIYFAYEDYEPFDQSAPEKSLLWAILMTALTDLKKEGELKRRAADYITNIEDEYLFSFESVCDFLHLDPNRVRKASGVSRRLKSILQDGRQNSASR